MAVNYSISAINARLQGVITTIDANGNGYLLLLANSTVLSRIQLARPCGTVDGGVLTFSGTLLDPSAPATGTANNGQIVDGVGNLVVSGLTVGAPLAEANIIMTNGLNTTAITAGQVVQLLAAQITETN